MRIGCLQFAPQVGDVSNNLNRADAVLSKASPTDLEDLELLVLPQLAFTGYNFKSLRSISPFLEPPGSGISSLWGRTTALRHNCCVVVGYPEKVDVSKQWPTSPEYYSSAIVVSNDGDTVANYRKHHLYYTDETWALEGREGFFARTIPGLGRVAMGICMDLNPYKFEAPWNAFEFAHHILESKARLVIISMAWLTRQDGRSFTQTPHEPDMECLIYWVQRLEPVVVAKKHEEIVVVFCNRAGMEGDAIYSGTSTVIGIKEGEVLVYGVLGRGAKEFLAVDTNKPPFAKLVHSPDRKGLHAWSLKPCLQPLLLLDTDSDDDDSRPPGEITSYLLRSPETPVAMSLFDQGAIPEEGPIPTEYSKNPFPSFPEPQNSLHDGGRCGLQASDSSRRLDTQTSVDDDVLVESPVSPSMAFEKPKLVIRTLTDTVAYKASPHPWQKQRHSRAVIYGDVSVRGGLASPTSPTTPFELDDCSTISAPTSSSVSYHSAMVATPGEMSDWTPLSPQSPTAIWKESSISSAIASLRREQHVTQSLDDVIRETTVEGDPEEINAASNKGLVLVTIPTQTHDPDAKSRSTESTRVPDAPKMIAIKRASRQSSRHIFKDDSLVHCPDRPQSPKSRNASQTREEESRDASIELEFVANQPPTPGDIGREIETWRPRSNPIITGRAPASRDSSSDHGLGYVRPSTRSHSLSRIDHTIQSGLQTRACYGMYARANSGKPPVSRTRQHRVITPRTVRRSFDGPHMRRVSRGRQPRGRSPSHMGHERSASAGRLVGCGSGRARALGAQRAASLKPVPPPPLVDGMVILNSDPRSRSFSRGRHPFSDDIVVDVSLVSPHCPLHGREVSEGNKEGTALANSTVGRRTALCQAVSPGEDKPPRPENMARRTPEAAPAPRLPSPNAMVLADAEQQAEDAATAAAAARD